uniref:Uncharacterized protein n=1 Tax=Anguilla anguilla TaxID=7936 RepID=A0A0E9VIG4_ANGAN
MDRAYQMRYESVPHSGVLCSHCSPSRLLKCLPHRNMLLILPTIQCCYRRELLILKLF